LWDALEVASRGGVTELKLNINGVDIVVLVHPISMKEEN
jgi:hypothetical protein